MKRLSLLLIILFFISSCSKSTISSNKIQGDWFIKSISENGIAISNPYEDAGYGSDLKLYYIFEKSSNTSGVINYREITVEHNPFYGTQIKSNTISLANYKISKDGEEIAINYSYKNINFKIETLTKDQLQLRSTNNTPEIRINFENLN